MCMQHICVLLRVWVTGAHLFTYIVYFVAMHNNCSPDRGSTDTGTHAGSAGIEAECIAVPYQPCSEPHNHLLADFHLLSLCVREVVWLRDCLCCFSSSITSRREIVSPLWKAYIRKSRWMSGKAGTILHPHSQGELVEAACAFHFFSWCRSV